MGGNEDAGNGEHDDGCCDRGRPAGVARRRPLGVRHSRELQIAVVAQNRLLELAQPRRGLQAELVAERPAARLVQVECVRLAPAAVEGEHGELAQPVAARLLCDLACSSSAATLRMVSEVELGLEPVLEGLEAELAEARALRRDERERSKAVEQVAAPEVERLGEHRRRSRRVAFLQDAPPLGGERTEPQHIKLVGLEVEHVAVSVRGQPLATCAGLVEQLPALETCIWSAAAAVAGGSSPQSASTSRSRDTTSSAWSASSASTAAGFSPAGRTVPSGPAISSGPSSRRSSLADRAASVTSLRL